AFPKRLKVIEAIMTKQEQEKKKKQADEELKRKHQREADRMVRKAQVDDDLKNLESELKQLEQELQAKDMSDGREKYTFSNGDEYDGEWKGRAMHGEGTYSYARTGNRYEGQWINNKKQGKGHMMYKQGGHDYTGEWTDNVKHGYGVSTDAAGNRYEGE